MRVDLRQAQQSYENWKGESLYCEDKAKENEAKLLEAEAQINVFLASSAVPSGVQTPTFSDRCAASQLQSDAYSYVWQRMFALRRRVRGEELIPRA